MVYREGDVVLCKFPYREDPLKFSNRPALVMSVEGNTYNLAQITCTDRSNKLVGVWLSKTSNEAMQMRLKEDSFINLSNILPVKEFAIMRLLGACPIMDKLKDLCDENNIQY